MTDPNYTHITVLLDRSGSMQTIDKDTVGGLNEFMKVQKATPGKATVTLIRFNNDAVTDYNNMAIADVPQLSSVFPYGGTAMYDAIGNSINSLGRQLEAMPECQRPGKVVFVIITDGEENASRHFTLHHIKPMIEEQQKKYNWQFVFLGANQDAVLTAGGMGISSLTSATFAASGPAVMHMFAATASNMSSYRCCSSPNAQVSAYSVEQREEMVK